MPCSSTTKPLSCPIIDSCLKLADSFPQTPSSSSTTPRFKLTQWAPESRPSRPSLATNLSYFEDYQPLDSPRTTPTGTSILILLWTCQSTFWILLNLFLLWANISSSQTPPSSDLNSSLRTKERSSSPVEQNRLDWGFQQKKYKVKAESHSSTSDRLAKQPFYTLLEIFRNILPKEEERHQHSAGAAIDRTTTYRFSYDKAFDISNTKFPSSTFPYPILFMDMSQSLANLLAAHPQLPLQGALGLSKLLSSSFTTTRSTQAPMVRTPSPEEKALLLQKVLSPTKENNPRVNPRAPTQIDPLIKLSMAEDLMTTLIQDPQDPHLPLSQNWQWTFNWPKSTPMCTSCNCLLGTNQQCFTCDQAPLPDTFNSKISMPIFDYWCPGILKDGKQCAQLLGQGQCSLCQFHLQFIKNEKNFHQQILPSSFEWTKILQFDLYFHQLEIAEEDSFLYCFKKSTKSLPMKYNQLEFDSFTFDDWPLYFVLFYHLDSRIDDWPPLPHPGKLPNKLPDFQKDQPDFINSGYPISERLLTDHLFACQWYSENIGKFIRYSQKTIMDNWQISFKDNPDIHPERVVCIPWDILVASSALIAIDTIDDKALHQHSLLLPTNFSDGFVDAILSPLQPRQRSPNFTVDELTNFINNSSLFQETPTPTMIWRTWAQFAPVSLT